MAASRVASGLVSDAQPCWTSLASFPCPRTPQSTPGWSAPPSGWAAHSGDGGRGMVSDATSAASLSRRQRYHTATVIALGSLAALAGLVFATGALPLSRIVAVV